MARRKGMGNLQLEKNGTWTIRIGFGGGRFSRSTGTASRACAERMLERCLKPLGLGAKKIPLSDAWRRYLQSPNRNELSPATLELKRNIWMHFARWMESRYFAVGDLDGVTASMVSEYLAEIRENIAATTYNCRVCALREMFRVVSEEAGIQENPWSKVKLRPDDSHGRRELSLDELRRLVACARTAEAADGEWLRLVLVGLYTGLRLGDCCRLDWRDINLEKGIIQIVPHKTRRHSHGRPVTIPVHPLLAAALAGGGRKGPVMPRIAELYAKGRWRVSVRLGGIFRKAGIETSVRLCGRRRLTPEATFHSLRHTFVSFAANAGVPLHAVQAIVGHSSPAMTRHYYHENIDTLRRAVAAIPSIAPAGGL